MCTWFARLAHPRRSCSAFAGWDSLANHSLGLIALGFARLLNWICIWPFTLNSQLLTFNSFPRFRADGDQTGLHDHPSLTIGGIRDRRFQFCTLLTDQRHGGGFAAGNFRNCAMHAAAMAMVPELEAILSPPVQCSISAKERSSVLATSTNRVRRTLNITRRVLISPEATNRLRSLWPTGDLEHSSLRCSYLIWPAKRPDPFDFIQTKVTVNGQEIPHLHRKRLVQSPRDMGDIYKYIL